MRVLQIIGSLGIGGAEKLVVETVPLLVDNGVEVDVLLLNGKKTAFYDELKSLNVTNIFSLGNTFYSINYIFKIIPYLKKYDIVHVHLFPAQYFVVLAKILSFSNVKLIFTEHSTGNKRLNNSFFKYFENFIAKYYTKIICITDEVKNVLIKKLGLDPVKLVTLENGVNLNKINNSVKYDKSNFGYKEEDVVLIMVAAFRAEKDHQTVVNTIAELPRNYKLIFVGDGVLRTTIEESVKSLNLEDRINFLGNRNDVYSLYKMTDIAILSSFWEGFGLSAVEAMACKVPLIASNVDGLAQVVEGGGILFEKQNTKDLKIKILELKDKSYYNITVNNGSLKAQQYDIGEMVKKLQKLYIEINK